MLPLGAYVCLALAAAAAAAAAGVYGAPTPVVPATVEPAQTTVFLKNALELRLVAVVAPSAMLARCLVRPPGATKFVELKEASDGRLSLLGDCGVRVRDVADEDEGEWTLSAEYDVGSATAVAVVKVSDFAAGMVPELPSRDEGGSLRLHLVAALPKKGKLKSCAAAPPQGDAAKPAVLDPANKEARVRYDGEGGRLADGWCGVRVEPLQAEDAGRWVLEAVAEDGVVHRAKTLVTVYRPTMQIVPAGPVYAEVGDTVTLTLRFAKAPAEDPGWKDCVVKKPDGMVVQVAGDDAAASNAVVLDDSSDLAKGRCVVRATLSSQDTGFWTLSAGRGKDSLRSERLRVFVNGPYVPVGGALKMTIGDKSGWVSCGPQSDVLACELRDPAGRLAVALDGPCAYKLDRVRADHRGTWTCSVVLRGYTKAASDSVQLVLQDPTHAEVGVVRDAGGVTLRCVLSECWAGGAASCRLVAPDGTSFMLKEAVRQGDFSYAGEGFDKCDCSMRIAGAPRDQHYGVWRCFVGSGKGSRPRGGLITLAKQDARSARSAPGDDVVAYTVPATGLVPPGTAMTVGCRAPRAISYCFLRTPLGEQLLLNENSRGERAYGGAGLAFGECAVTMVMAANLSGTWQCGLGAAGAVPGVDVEVPVQVTVSESLAVAVQTNVTAWPGGRDASLACRTVLGEAIQYCRFHRPDGSSVHLADHTGAVDFQVDLPYRYAGSGGSGLRDGYCGVNISTVSDADFGPWTCVVALVGDASGTEYSVSLMLQHGDLGLGGVDAALTGMAVVLAALLLAGTGVVVYRRYFRRPFAALDEAVSLEERPSLSSSPGSTRTFVTRTRGRARTARAAPARVLGAATAMQTSRFPASTTRTRTRSARSGSLEQVETVVTAAASSYFSDSSQEAEFERPAGRSARKLQ